jgi:hypothetical protein
MVDIISSQALARVTLLLSVGGSFDPRAPGNLADAHTPEHPEQILTRNSP